MPDARKTGSIFPLAWAVLLALAGVALAARGVKAIAAGQVQLPLVPALDFASRPGAFYALVSALFAFAVVCAYAAMQFLQDWRNRRDG